MATWSRTWAASRSRTLRRGTCRTLTVSGQLQQLGGQLVPGPPKSDAGWRVIALDKTTIAALREHKARQPAAGAGWAEAGYVFTTLTGRSVRPD